jgi:hypothetical protein
MEGTRLMSAYANQPAMVHHSVCLLRARCCSLRPPQNRLAVYLARWNQNSSWTEKGGRLSPNPESECLVPCQAQVRGLALTIWDQFESNQQEGMDRTMQGGCTSRAYLMRSSVNPSETPPIII